jgi:hypothetical protein
MSASQSVAGSRHERERPGRSEDVRGMAGTGGTRKKVPLGRRPVVQVVVHTAAKQTHEVSGKAAGHTTSSADAPVALRTVTLANSDELNPTQVTEQSCGSVGESQLKVLHATLRALVGRHGRPLKRAGWRT